MYLIILLRNDKYYYFIDYTEKISILALFYTFVESFIKHIIICIATKNIIPICRECLLNIDEIRRKQKSLLTALTECFLKEN